MGKQYYYLISSLVDLELDVKRQPYLLTDFLELCKDEMTVKDYDNLKKIFLFNDMKNAVNHKKIEEKYLYPAYYTKDTFRENLKDTDSFLPFLAEYFYNSKNDKRIYPEMMEIDEIVLLFYKYLEELGSKFINDYFLFELDLQNITTALTLKNNNKPLQNKIIPHGENYSNILKSSSPDFGLSGSIGYLDRLVDVYKDNDLIEIEKTIEDIRWKWIDEYILLENFSAHNVFGYAVKLKSVERWMGLTDKKGEEVLENLINEIKSSIKFSEEFSRG